MLIPQIHVRKIWPVFAGRIMAREKTFEIRREDRSIFRAGDTLELLEWCPKIQRYSGLVLRIKISYVLRDSMGIEPGFAILGLHWEEQEYTQHAIPPHGPSCGYMERYGLTRKDLKPDELYFIQERQFLE